MNGGESGATGPTRAAEGCNERTGRSVSVEDSGFERGEGVLGGFETEGRGWKRFGWVMNVGLSLERRRPSATAAVEAGAAGVGTGICSSGGSCRPIVANRLACWIERLAACRERTTPPGQNAGGE